MIIKRLLFTIISSICLASLIGSCSTKSNTPLEISPNVINTPSAKIEINNRSYDTYLNFPYDNMIFADKKAFEIIKDLYSKMNFYGEFKKGRLSNYDTYKKRFKELLKNAITFIDKDTGKEAYLKDFDPLKVYNGENYAYDLNSYNFYFFDFDEDNTPELCISNAGNIYIFKFDSEQNKISLIYKIESAYLSLIGSNKIAWDSETGAFPTNAFYVLNGDGQLLCSVTFYSKQDNSPAYMVSLPQYTNHESQITITKEIKNYAYFDETQKLYCFRVTEEQFDELTKDYFNAVGLSHKKINDLTFSYNELFGNLN